MHTTLSVQFGAPYIPIPKDRGFTANPDKRRCDKRLALEISQENDRLPWPGRSFSFVNLDYQTYKADDNK